jgi:hypothetical protein
MRAKTAGEAHLHISFAFSDAFPFVSKMLVDLLRNSFGFGLGVEPGGAFCLCFRLRRLKSSRYRIVLAV